MEPTRYCPNCGAELEPKARFCAACGQPVPQAAGAPPPSASQPDLPPPPWEAVPAQGAGSPAQASSAPPPFAGTPPTYGTTPAVPPPGASYAPPKKKSRTGVLVLGGCLLLLLLVGVLAVGGVLWYKLQEDGRTSDGASSGGVSVATLPAQTGVARGELLYSDDFSDPESGWDIREADDASTVYQNGAYHITVNDIDWVAWGNPYAYFTDFVLEVEATQVSGTDDNDVGVLLRYVDVDNFYRFEISGDGYYSFDLMEDDEWTTLIDWTDTPAIRQGNSTNTITVVCDGDLFTFYVNGEYLDECRDGTFAEGDIGLLAGTIEEAPVHIAFDNVRVYALP